MSAAPWTVGVVVPARDEAERIGACLASIGASLAVAPAGTVLVAVVADACVDATAAIAAEELTGLGGVVVADVGNVGRARRLGTDHVLGQLVAGGADPRRTWLCSTDADSTVPLAWVADHLRQAEAGAAAVAGVVRVDSFDGHADLVRSRYLDRYATGLVADPADRAIAHRHVHGANLGVRADAYLAVGGWSGLPSAEDHDLWTRLRTGGWKVVASTECWVTTSGRAAGRAPDGFAGLLTSLGAS